LLKAQETNIGMALLFILNVLLEHTT